MRRRWAPGLFAAWLLSCGVSPMPLPVPDAGKVCFENSDCAPNKCCGMGDAVVHRSEAPDCSAVKCTGTCPPNGIRCGCAIPVCRESRCTSAISPTPEC